MELRFILQFLFGFLLTSLLHKKRLFWQEVISNIFFKLSEYTVFTQLKCILITPVSQNMVFIMFKNDFLKLLIIICVYVTDYVKNMLLTTLTTQCRPILGQRKHRTDILSYIRKLFLQNQEYLHYKICRIHSNTIQQSHFSV